jgi:hypothetical protein
MLGTADFTATNGTTVVLATGASSGDLVTTESFYVSSVLNAIPATNGAVTSAYLLDGSVTQAKLATNVAGNGPAFSAYQSAAQSITGSVNTKVTMDLEEFDTASCFNTSTYRFTPTVAGYYQFNWLVNMGSYSNRYTSALYKNGSVTKTGVNGIGNGSNNAGSGGSAIVNANGSTDYFEIYVEGNNSSSTLGGASNVYFNGAMVRAA